jgi:hypothetical protein
MEAKSGRKGKSHVILHGSTPYLHQGFPSNFSVHPKCGAIHLGTYNVYLHVVCVRLGMLSRGDIGSSVRCSDL